MEPYRTESPTPARGRHGAGMMGRLRKFMAGGPQHESIKRFDGIERIGSGCMGEVYRAFDTVLKEAVALKISMDNPSARLSFENEERALSRVRHRNIVRLLDSGIFSDGIFSGRPFLVTGIVEGEGLSGILAREGRLGWMRAKAVLLELCDALHAVHESGLIHRDVKPDNIIVGKGGTTLMDFGVSERLASKFSIRSIFGRRFMPGDLEYTAPEVISGRCGRATDIYSAGMVMRRMLAGKAVSDMGGIIRRILEKAQDPIIADIGIAPEQAAIIVRATAPLPEKRYPSVLEMKSAIESL